MLIVNACVIHCASPLLCSLTCRYIQSNITRRTRRLCDCFPGMCLPARVSLADRFRVKRKRQRRNWTLGQCSDWESMAQRACAAPIVESGSLGRAEFSIERRNVCPAFATGSGRACTIRPGRFGRQASARGPVNGKGVRQDRSRVRQEAEAAGDQGSVKISHDPAGEGALS